MSKDFGFTPENERFRNRIAGVIFSEDKMLFIENTIDNTYYDMIGGGVHMGETLIVGIECEISEEASLEAKSTT